MATKTKSYGYYWKGSQLALVEQETTSYPLEGYPEARTQWTSPTATVEDALEIEYCYSPEYELITQVKLSNSTTYQGASGYLTITTATDPASTTPAIAAGTYMIFKKAGRWNGMHKVTAVTGSGPYVITFDTLYDDTASVAWEETPDMYYNVNVLNSADDEIPLTPYLEKALIYYIKAKVFEDMMDIERKEYFMREFRRTLEKHENSKVYGARILSSGPNAIR